jgi:hypothetical protein
MAPSRQDLIFDLWMALVLTDRLTEAREAVRSLASSSDPREALGWA